ncbi:hypothetical protein ACLOJK_022838 [Asimina triloba]
MEEQLGKMEHHKYGASVVHSHSRPPEHQFRCSIFPKEPPWRMGFFLPKLESWQAAAVNRRLQSQAEPKPKRPNHFRSEIPTRTGQQSMAVRPPAGSRPPFFRPRTIQSRLPAYPSSIDDVPVASSDHDQARRGPLKDWQQPNLERKPISRADPPASSRQASARHQQAAKWTTMRNLHGSCVLTCSNHAFTRLEERQQTKAIRIGDPPNQQQPPSATSAAIRQT